MSQPHSPWHALVVHAIFSTDLPDLWDVAWPFHTLPTLVPELVERGTTEGEGVGMTRTLHLVGGGTVTEELIAFHPEHFLFTYAMKQAPENPWTHYFCTVRLQSLGAGQTHLSFNSYFQPRPNQETTSRQALTAAYHALLTGYSRTLSAPFTLQPA